MRWPAQCAICADERFGRRNDQLGRDPPQLARRGALVRMGTLSIRLRRRAARQRLARKLFEQVKFTSAVWALFEMFINKRPLVAIQQPLLISGQLIAGWAEHAKQLLAEQPLHLLKYTCA